VAEVSVAKRHDWRYFFTQVAVGKENYYLDAVQRGEPPGVWQGRAAADLGLSGEVDEPSMQALFDHRVDPRDPRFRDPDAWLAARKLGSPYRDEVPRRPPGGAAGGRTGATPERVEQLRLKVDQQSRRAVIYFDVTFSPQKSVSVLHAAFQAMQAAATKAGSSTAAARWARCGGGGGGGVGGEHRDAGVPAGLGRVLRRR
jgi:hypothetical protein